MRNNYTWWLDSREKNKKFLQYQVDEEWRYEAIRASKIFILDEGDEDADIADFTNTEVDGLVEFKSLADGVGSLAGDGVEHLEEQCIRLHATGIPSAVIIYGDIWTFMRISRTNLEFMLSAMLKAMAITTIFHVPIGWALNEEMAIEEAKTFIRHCEEYPRRLPLTNKFKRTHKEHAVISVAGFKSIGPTLAINFLKGFGCIHDFHLKLEELRSDWEGVVDIEPAAAVLAGYVEKIGPAKMKSIMKSVLKRFDDQ